MGIVRLSERDVVRRSTDARERAGQPGSSQAHGVGHRHGIVAASSVDIVAHERARHSTADRLRIRDPAVEEESRLAS